MKRALISACIAALLLPLCAEARQEMAVPITVLTVVDLKKERREAKLKRTFCQRVKAAKGQVSRLLPLKAKEQGREEQFAKLVRYGESGCPKNLDLAIALVISNPSASEVVRGGGQMLFSEAAFRRDRGNPEDLDRAEEIARLIWLRAGTTYPGLQPRWSEAERIAFLSREDIWAVLNDPALTQMRLFELRSEVLLDPASSRFDPVRAVEELSKSSHYEDRMRAVAVLRAGKVVPADPGRAEALLWDLAKFQDSALAQLLDLIAPRMGDRNGAERAALTARLRTITDPRFADDRSRLATLVVPGLSVVDTKTQIGSAWLLSRLVRSGERSQEPVLLDWIVKTLKSPNRPSGDEARSMLGWLVIQGSVPARAALDREIARSGGLVDAGLLTPDPARPAPLDKLFTSNDYPSRGLREELEAVVEGWGVIGPDGRLVLVEMEPLSDDHLAQIFSGVARSTIQRRLKRPYADWPGRYVRVKLPPIQFRLPNCDGDRTLTPLAPGAIVIEGKCRQPPLFSRPIY